MERKQVKVDPEMFPEEFRPLLAGAKVYDSSCSPEARTLYSDAGYYVKIAPKGKLALEADLGRRFGEMGLGVEVMMYLSSDRDYLVTRSADGEDLTHLLHDPEGICRVLADGLQRIHSCSVKGLPLSAKLTEYTDSGGFNEYLRMAYIGIHSREEALSVIQAHGGRLKRDTFIHGDACLPNVICRDGTFATFIDCGLAGRGDRHIDLFWAIWSLQFNLKTEQYTDHFLELYGREYVDFEILKLAAAYEMIG